MKKRSLVLTLAAMMVVLPLYAAQGEGYFAMSLAELLDVEISTPSKYAENFADSPANVTVITREQILERGYRNIGDILKALPGVDTQSYALFNSPLSSTFRGHAGNNKFLVLQDGVRLSSVGGEAINLSFNFPLYYAKQVEVVMGPSSVTYGADAFMGVINIISMDEELARAEVSVGVDGYRHGSVYLNQTLESGLQWSLGAQGYRSQRFEFAEDFPEFYPPGTLSPVGNPFQFPRSQDESFFSRIETQKYGTFGLNFSQMDASNFIAAQPTFSAFDPGSVGQTRTATLYGELQRQVTERIRSTSLLTLMYYELGNSTNFNNIFTGFVPLYKYAKSERLSLNQDFVLELNAAHKISLGLVYDTIDSIPIGPDLPSPHNTSRSVTEQGLMYSGTTLPIVFFENNHENIGAYLQDNWKLAEQWRLVLGMRYDKDSFYGESVNPRLSAIYRPDAHNLVKILYGHAFLAPSSDLAFKNFGGFSGLDTTTGLWQSGFFQAPNPELQAEKLQTLEFNYEYWFDGHATHIKFAPYYTRIDDVIRLSPDVRPRQFIPGAQINFSTSNKNTGTMDIYGMDLTFENRTTWWGLQVRTWGGLSLVDGRLEENDVKTELPLISNYKVKGGVSVISKHGVTITPQFYWIGEANDNQADPNAPERRLRTPGYFLTDLHGEFKVNKGLALVLDIYNLFDVKFTNATHIDEDLYLRGPATRTVGHPRALLSIIRVPSSLEPCLHFLLSRGTAHTFWDPIYEQCRCGKDAEFGHFLKVAHRADCGVGGGCSEGRADHLVGSLTGTTARSAYLDYHVMGFLGVV